MTNVSFTGLSVPKDDLLTPYKGRLTTAPWSSTWTRLVFEYGTIKKPYVVDSNSQNVERIINDWLFANIEKSWGIYLIQNDLRAVIFFQDNSDAMLFKLQESSINSLIEEIL